MKRYIFAIIALIIAATGSWAQTTTYGLSTGTCEHGTIKFYIDGSDVTDAAEGDNVIVSVFAADGWLVGIVTAEASTTWGNATTRGTSGGSIPFADIKLTKVANATNQWSFKMPPADVSVSATFISITVNIPANGYAYDGTEKKPTVTVKEGTATLTIDQDYTVSYADNVDAGTKAKVTVKGKGNYDFSDTRTFSIARKSITAVVEAQDKQYDGTATATVTATIETGVTGETLSISGLTGEFENADVGTNKVVTVDNTAAIVKGGGNTKLTNYEIKIPESATASITPKAATITAASSSKTYNGSALKNSSFTVSGLEAGEHDFTVTMTSSSSITNVGSKANVIATVDGVTVTAGTPTVVGNYLVTTVNGTLTVTKATMKSVSAKGYSGEYDGQGHSITVTKPSGATVKYRIGTTGSYSTTNPTFTDAGEYTVYYQVTKSNYTTKSGNAKVTITAKALTVKANDHSITYGEAPANDGVTYDGFVDGDDASKLEGTLDFDYSYSQNDDIGDNYTITPKGLTSNNYDITFMSGTLTVLPADMDGIEVAEYSGEYDGAAHGISVTAPKSATVKFGTSEGTYDLDASPEFTDVCEETVYYQVTMDNHNATTGNAKVTITAKKVDEPTIQLSETYYFYDGTAKKPKVKVEDGTTTIPETEYTVSYSDNTEAGTATVTITDKEGGNYTVSGMTTFEIGICGDANGDQEVNAVDIVYVVSYLNGKTLPGFNANNADADGTGDITEDDVTAINDIIMGK